MTRYNKISVALLTATTLFFSGPIWAAEKAVNLEKELAKIATNTNALERLAAYDALAANAVKPSKPEAKSDKPAATGKWNIDVSKSPVDDSKTIIARLEANEMIKVSFGEKRPVLVLRSKEGRFSGYVNYDTFLGSDEIAATLRFGSEKAYTEKWSLSTDHKAAFVSGSAVDFISKLDKVDTFLIRLTPYGESPVTVTFSTEGMPAVIRALFDINEE